MEIFGGSLRGTAKSRGGPRNQLTSGEGHGILSYQKDKGVHPLEGNRAGKGVGAFFIMGANPKGTGKRPRRWAQETAPMPC